MKKLLTLLFIAPFLFSACGDEEEDKPYYNPVEGSWVYSLPNFNYTETRVFTKDFEASSTSNNDGDVTSSSYGKYKINETYLQYEKTGNIHHYVITKDTLLLIHQSSGWEEKYIKVK